MQDITNGLAPGISQQKAQSDVNNLRELNKKQIVQRNLDYANKVAAIHAMSPNPLKQASQVNDPRGPVVDNNAYQSAIEQGRLYAGHESRMPAGAIPAGQVPIINEEIKSSKINRNGLADWYDVYKKLADMKFAGQVPAARALGSALGSIGKAGSAILGGLAGGPAGALAGGAAGSAADDLVSHAGSDLASSFERERNTLVKSLRQRLGRDSNSAERDELVDSILPSWNDTESSSKAAFDSGIQHFKSLDVTPNLDQYNLKTPFPELKYISPKKGKSSEISNPAMEEKLMEDNKWKKK